MLWESLMPGDRQPLTPTVCGHLAAGRSACVTTHNGKQQIRSKLGIGIIAPTVQPARVTARQRL